MRNREPTKLEAVHDADDRETRNPPPGVDGPRSYWQRMFNKEVGEPLHKVFRRHRSDNGEFERRPSSRSRQLAMGTTPPKIVAIIIERRCQIAYLRLKPELLQDYFDFFAVKRWQYFLFMQKEESAGNREPRS